MGRKEGRRKGRRNNSSIDNDPVFCILGNVYWVLGTVYCHNVVVVVVVVVVV